MEKFKLERPVLAVDVVVFSLVEDRLGVLLPRRNMEPFRDAPALPGVAVRSDETLENAARRALSEKTLLPPAAREGIFLEQLATFDALYRDPRGRTVSVAYMGLFRMTSEEVNTGRWRPVSDIEEGTLPFDHNQILDAAVTRLQGKLRYTNIAGGFLPETFRIETLQAVYESILGRSLNRSNFRNKLLKIGLIEQVKVLTDAVGKKGGRPPHLYRFTRDMVEAADRDFL